MKCDRTCTMIAITILLAWGAAAYGTPVTRGWGLVKASYDAGKLDQARLIYRGQVESYRLNVVVSLSKNDVRADILQVYVRSIVELHKGATKWENEHDPAGPVSPEALKQIQLARTAFSDIRDAVQKNAKSDRAAAIAPQVDQALKEALADEVAMLEKSGQKDQAKALQAQYQAFLAAPVVPARLDPDSLAFIELSGAAAGPFQPILACYAMGQPEAGRVRLIELLIRMRSEVRTAVVQGKLTAEVARTPRIMAEYIVDIAEKEKAGPERSALVVTSVAIARDTADVISRGITATTSEDIKKQAEYTRQSMEVLRKYGIRTGAIKESEAGPSSQPAGFRSVQGQDAKVQVTGQDYQIISAINSFYDALAAGDAAKLTALLAVGPEYASAEELLSYLAKRQSAGKFEKIAGYRIGVNTIYSINDGTPKRAMVVGLQAEVVIDKQPTIKTASGMFDVLIKDGQVRLGYPKSEFAPKSPKETATTAASSPATNPTTAN